MAAALTGIGLFCGNFGGGLTCLLKAAVGAFISAGPIGWLAGGVCFLGAVGIAPFGGIKMNELYILWVCITIVYFVISFFIFRNKEKRNNYEILYPLVFNLYLVFKKEASRMRSAYLFMGVLAVILVYFLALDIYRWIKKKDGLA